MTIPPERFYEMSRGLFDVAEEEQERYNDRVVKDAPMWAKYIGHLAGLAWLAHEAGEAAEREKKL